MVVQPVGVVVGNPAMAMVNASYTVASDCDRLYYAMVGFGAFVCLFLQILFTLQLGTDDSELVEIIGTRPRQHLNAVAMAYRQRHGHDLVHDLKGDTSFCFKDLLVGLG